MSPYGDMLSGGNTDGLVWKALADDTRRQILDALADGGPLPTKDLVARFPELSRTAVMKHLDILVAANLVLIRREGRLRFNHLNPIPIQEIYDRWVHRFVRGHAARLTRLRAHVQDGLQNQGDKK